MRGFHRYTAGEPADHLKFPAAAIRIGPLTERLVNLFVEPGLSRWQDADHGAGPAVQAQRFAHDIWIGTQATPPEPVADHQHAIVVSAMVVRGRKVPPQHRRYSE